MKKNKLSKILIIGIIFLIVCVGFSFYIIQNQNNRLNELEQLITKDNIEYLDNLPYGAIIMWKGVIDDIPKDWVLCNGENGTPDLRDKFIVSIGNNYTIGDMGGLESVILTIAQMPSHNHNAFIEPAGEHSHNYSQPFVAGLYNKAGTDSYWVGVRSDTTDSVGLHSHSISIDNTGEGQAHENRPPYYALYFIMKI